MSELRQNPITKQWVLIAPSRSKRPEEYTNQVSVMRGEVELDSTCVFCPGNEAENTDVFKIPENDNWQIRIIPNKYEAVSKAVIYSRQDFYNRLSGTGVHEVIITRKHNEPVALQSIALVEEVLTAILRRMRELKEDKTILYTQVFHNHGREAGASLVHPHYQLIALAMVPPHIQAEIQGCFHYFQAHHNCIYCDIIKEEKALDERVVYESDHFIVISAYASRSPFETWILPKSHQARFEDISKDELKHLSYVLKVTLGQLYTKLNDPPLNFYIHTMPNLHDGHSMNEEASYHWHLTIFPRITTWAGFEFATGIPINPVIPEDAVKFLKS